MEGKLRQVTDNIHGTIYLSDIESRMISTPFFYRLHDIYQSSTVYMTFPSNRTKRYEHCLGTMEQAGQMFFSSVTNTSKKIRQRFIDELYKQFTIIADAFKNRTNSAFYFNNTGDMLAKALPKSKFKDMDNLKALIAVGMSNGAVSDIALSHQSVCFFDLLGKHTQSSGDQHRGTDAALLYAFLYQCALQAVRIAALFHDIGHPPFSHIIEETLLELYDGCGPQGDDHSDFVEEKAACLKSMLEPFIGRHSPPELLLNSGKTINAALHEQIGLKMLQSAFQRIFGTLLQEATERSQSLACKTTRSLYYVTVIELTFAILLEQNPLCTAFHRMIDGPIDSDRLDYIVRDSENSGIDWGRIPYNRIVCSAMLASTPEGQFTIAFPEKMADDLDDILVARYKVFSRINYHHRSTKTAHLLQKAVSILARDYLCTPVGKECICANICDLWTALGATLGKQEEENKAAKWNDSWLISVLHSALIKLSDDGTCEALESSGSPVRTATDIRRLQDLLEEVLLNHKHYYALLKRQKDAKNLIEKILLRSGITNERLERLLQREYQKLFSKTGEDAQEAQESLYRVGRLMDNILPRADFEELEIYFLGESCESRIVHILEGEQQNNTISDFIVSPNVTRYKLGISDELRDRIYLYAPDGTIYPYDINGSLFPLLQAHRMANLWLNVYVSLPSAEKAADTLTELSEKVQGCIGDDLATEFSRLFPQFFKDNLSDSQVC